MNKFNSIFRYATLQRFIAITIAAIIIFCWIFDVVTHGSLWTGKFSKSSFVEGWNDNYNAYAGLATLLVALAVWFGDVYDDWLDNLPKKLTVRFELKGRLILECRRAGLSGLGDSRALAQQIGKQMVRGQDLNFVAPAIKQMGGAVCYETDTGHYRDYHLTVILLDLEPYTHPKIKTAPPSLDDTYFIQVVAPAIINKTAYLSWAPPFDSRPELVPLATSV